MQAEEEALDLLSSMVRFDPAQRITAAEALQHRFFTQGTVPTPPERLPRPRGRVDAPLARPPEPHGKQPMVHGGARYTLRCTCSARRLLACSGRFNAQFLCQTLMCTVAAARHVVLTTVSALQAVAVVCRRWQQDRQCVVQFLAVA